MTPVGLLHQMWELRDADEKAFYARAAAEAHLADRLGFASLWIGEHHYRQPGPFYGRVPAPELLIANLAARTTRIRFGTGVKVLPLSDPARTAEQMAMLFLLADGRVEFGLGQGTGTAPVVIPDRRRKSEVFRDTVGRLLELLATGPGTPDGHLISPIPEDELRNRLWIASRDELAVRFAAENGLGLVVGQAEHPTKQRRYVELYRDAGGTGQVRGVRIVHTSGSDADARNRIGDAARLYWATMRNGPYHREAVEEGLLPPGEPDTLDELLARSLFVVGDPVRVRAELRAYQTATGVDRVDVMMQLPLLPHDLVADAMALFMAEVAPTLGAVPAE